MKELELIVPIRPMSLHQYYGRTSSGRQYISKRGKQFKKDFALKMMSLEPKLKLRERILKGKKYEVEYIFYTETLFKNGTYKKIDCDNLGKVTQDNLFDFIGIDDCHAFKTITEKIDSKLPHIRILIRDYHSQ